MRVTAGKVKGHRLKAPKDSLVRPTTGLVREAMFSMLGELASTQVLDLYAGSGALGIEALSRGAEQTDFVDRDPGCCAIIRENLERTGLAGRARVYCCGIARAFSLLRKNYDVIFLDPPYADFSLGKVLNSLVNSRLVTRDSTIVVQHSSHLSLALDYGEFHLIKNRHYGETCVSIYHQEEAN